MCLVSTEKLAAYDFNLLHFLIARRAYRGRDAQCAQVLGLHRLRPPSPMHDKDGTGKRACGVGWGKDGDFVIMLIWVGGVWGRGLA